MCKQVWKMWKITSSRKYQCVLNKMTGIFWYFYDHYYNFIVLVCASTIVPLVPSSPKESTLQLRHNDRVASQITSLTIVHSTVYSGADHRKHPCSASLAFSEGSLPVTGEFLPQKASNAENVSIWRRHYGVIALYTFLKKIFTWMICVVEWWSG